MYYANDVVPQSPVHPTVCTTINATNPPHQKNRTLQLYYNGLCWNVDK